MCFFFHTVIFDVVAYQHQFLARKRRLYLILLILVQYGIIFNF